MVVALGSQPQSDTLELDAGTVRDPAQVADEAGSDRGEQRLDRARPVDVVFRRGVVPWARVRSPRSTTTSSR
jgi:hypothetical protein